MTEIRKLIRFDIVEVSIIKETMIRYGISYNGALALIIRNWKEITSGMLDAVKENKDE